MKLEDKLEEICAKAIGDFFSSTEVHEYLYEFLMNNKTFVLTKKDGSKKLPIQCDISIQVDVKVLTDKK